MTRETEGGCKHVRGFDVVRHEGGALFASKPATCAYSVEWFSYCPRCGEKLQKPESTDDKAS